MTVQKLIERLARVPVKTKDVAIAAGDTCGALAEVKDTKGGMIFLVAQDWKGVIDEQE